MPSKAFKLAEAMVSNPVMSDIVTDTTAVPVSITNKIEVSTDQGVASVEDLPNTGNSAGDIQLVEATNRLYVWNGSGWYNIALINTTPAWDSGGQPAASYELDADSPQTATSITLAATDPEGLPISYTYVTSGQMDSIATVSQDSSVFTITPKTSTQIPDGGTGSITFRASDGINILPQVSSFTLIFSSIVSDSNHTTLLATATGGSDNNNITDASTNNHSITVGADAYAGTFSPYREGGYSTYFDSTDRVYLTNDMSAALGTSEFSMEAWIYRTTTDADENVIVNGPGNDNGWGLAISSGKIRARFHNTNLISGATTVSPNEWHHVMIARTASNELLIFLDGTLDARSTSSSVNYNATSTTLTVGSYGDRTSAVSYGFNGYVRDARVIVGYNTFPYGSYGTSVGINYFTPPSEPLTAVSGTEALLCGLPYHGDLSSNSHSVSETGGASTKPFSPYDYEEYSATDQGGSVYFDGTGDYLSISNQGISGDLTYEGWFYQTVAQSATYRTLISSSTYASGVPFRVYTNNTNIQVWTDGSSGAEITEAFEPYTWFHIAIVRSSGTWTLYVNGKSAGTTTVGGTYNFASTTGWSVGGSQTGSYPFTGYASDVKLTNSAVYSSNFTPSTSPLSSSGAELHIKGTDASIIDKSQTTNIKLVGGTNGTTTQAKFANTRSMYFDESGDHIDVSEGFIPLRTSDFTIETWFYPTANPSNHEGIFSNGTHSSGNWLALLYQTNRIIRYDIGGGSSSNLSTTAVSLNTWCHIALCRSGGNIRLYINGTQEHTEANSSDLDYETARIGDRIGLTGYALNSAYLQDFRITKGLARYTATDETSNIPSAPLEG